jgi:hypothetical protein
MSSGKIIGAALFIVLLAGVGGAIWLVSPSAEEPQDGDVQPAPPVKGSVRPNGRTPLDVVPEVKFKPPPAPLKIKDPLPVTEAPTFTYEGYESGLNNVSWHKLAPLMFHQNRDLPQTAIAHVRGGVLDDTLFRRVSDRYVVISEALHPMVGNFDSLTALSCIGHPAVASNVLAKTLEASGLPLSDAQQTSLRDWSVTYIAKDDARRKALPRDAIWMRRAASEMKLRIEYMDGARKLLTKDQGRAVSVGSLTHRVGFDPFSPTILMMDRVIPLDFAEDDAAVDSGVDAVMGAMGLIDQALREPIRDIVKEWVANLPESTRRFRGGHLTLMGAPDAGRTVLGAEITADLYERVLESVRAGPTAEAMLRSIDQMVNPLIVQ